MYGEPGNKAMVKKINIIQTITCPICHRPSTWRLARKDGWDYYGCRSCSLVYIHPQPSPEFLTSQYQGYLPEDEIQIRSWRLSMEEVFRQSADLIEQRKKPGRILDVGCGYGFFLNHMAQRGWQAEGLEISAVGRRYASAHFPDMPIRSAPLPDPAIPEGAYDAVTLFYVLEHLADPIGVLQETRRILKPGGVLLLRWPHTTPIVRLLGPFARILDLYHTPYHLFDYSPRFIKKAMTASGFGSIQTGIAGYTRPDQLLARYVSIIFGGLGEFLSRRSSGRVLLPGVSKTTIAVK